jgi:uncharacterized membrane protein YkoI
MSAMISGTLLAGLVALGPVPNTAPVADLAAAVVAADPAKPVTLDEAAALVRQKVGGRVVRAETREEGGDVIHEFRVVSADGRVRTVRVDAATGTIR